MRVWWIVAALLVALVAAPAAGSPAAPAAAVVDAVVADEPPADDARPPDVIVIMTDDQRVGTERAMPAVSAFFSRGGVRYPNAQTPTNLCCPGRAAFLTGRYAHSTGVWENSGPFGGYRAFAKSESSTLPLALQQVGYDTALFGKYINHFNRFTTDDYVPPGWNTFHVPQSPNLDGGYWTPIRGLPAGYGTDVLGSAAADYIADSDPDTPLFLMYTPFAPHHPFDAGPYRGLLTERQRLAHQRYGRYRNPSFNEKDVSDKPKWVRTLRPLRAGAVRNVVRQQAEALLGVDANVARILRSQERYRDLGNTLVVYLSDNGFAWGEHRLNLKRHPYSLANRIPMWVRFPVGTPAGAGVSTALVNQLDATATIADLAGAPMDTDGISLLSGQRRNRLLLEAAPSRGGVQKAPGFCGFRTPRHLFINYTTGERELYDLARDPYEMRNLIRTSPAARSLGARLAAQFTAAGCDLAEIRRMPGARLDGTGD